MLPDAVLIIVVYFLLCKTPLAAYFKGSDLQ
jgi:hypothetical protein